LRRRRETGAGWSGYPDRQVEENWSSPGDFGGENGGCDKNGLPIGVLRFRADARERRAKLERDLLAGPLGLAERERLLRWLNHMKAREAWQTARLEHIVGMRNILLKALGRNQPGYPDDAGSRAAEQPVPAEIFPGERDE